MTESKKISNNNNAVHFLNVFYFYKSCEYFTIPRNKRVSILMYYIPLPAVLTKEIESNVQCACNLIFHIYDMLYMFHVNSINFFLHLIDFEEISLACTESKIISTNNFVLFNIAFSQDFEKSSCRAI